MQSHVANASAIVQALEFDDFFEARRRELLERIGAVMGKTLVTEPTAATEDPMGYDELEPEEE